VFGVGLVGASLLAAAVLPRATSHAVAEAFGFPRTSTWTSAAAACSWGRPVRMVVLGALVALIPGAPMMQFLVGVQAPNAALPPVILFFLMRLINDQRLVGELASSRLPNVLGWGTFTVVTLAVLVYPGSRALGRAGRRVTVAHPLLLTAACVETDARQRPARASPTGPCRPT
jgi:Mn2+/Fe2+ NRAMP family transporter